MDNRRIIVGLVASLAVFYVYLFLVNKFAPPPKPTTQPTASRVVESRPGGTEAPASRPSTRPAEAAVTSRPEEVAEEQVIVEGGTASASVALGSAREGNPFPMAVEITPRGAAILSADIRDHYMTVKKEQPYRVFAPMTLPTGTDGTDTFYSFLTPRIRFDNLRLEASLGDVNWAIVEQTEEQVTFAVTVKTLQGAPLARVLKTYHLARQPAKPDQRDKTYDLEFSVTVENLSGDDFDTIITQQGPVGFHKEELRGEDRRVVIASWLAGEFEVEGQLRSEIISKPGKIAVRDDDSQQTRVAWAAEANKYFACIMAPADRIKPSVPAEFALVEPAALREAATEHQEDLTFRFVTKPLAIAPGKSRQISFECYIGPKSKSAFEAVPAYQDRHYFEVIRESFYWCAPDALTAFMMGLLDFFHRVPPNNYGVAIIILVLVVRLLLHPLTKKSQVNMMKMQQQQATLQPKLKAIREKYANDKVRQNQATMDLYREEGINPAGSILSCLPMMLQIPIWGALWAALSSTIEMRHAPFDGWWIRDLAAPDAVYALAHPVNLPLIGFLMGGPVESINLLPILLAISQMLQTLYMPKAAQTPQTEGVPDQRKMMMFMSVMFIFFLWNAPSGLNLYIMASNLFGILEQQRIRKHIKELEARRPEEEARRREKAKQAPRSWISRKWAELAREIEEAKKVQSAKAKKRK